MIRVPRMKRRPGTPGLRRRAVLLTAVAGALATGLAGCGSGGGSDGGSGSDDTLKIGFVTTLSNSSFSGVGVQSEAAFDAAVAHLRKESGAVKLKTVKGDDGGDAAQATDTCRRLIEKENVQVIVAVMLTPNKNACSLVAKQAGVPFIAGQQSAPNCDTNYFQTGWVPNQVVEPLINYLAEKKLGPVYFVGNDYAFDQDIFKVLKTYAAKKGVEVVGSSFAPIGTTAWAPILNRVAGSGAKVVVDGMIDEVAYQKQSGADPRTAGLHRISVTADEAQIQTAGSVVAGLSFVSNYVSSDESPANAAFKEELKAAGKGKVVPSLTSVNLYNATLAAAAAAAKGTDKDSLLKALPDVAIDTPGGKLDFDGKHNPTMTSFVASTDQSLTPTIVYTDKPLAAETGCK